VVGKRVRAGMSAVLCSHGPVLPEIVREIALATATPLGSYVTDAAGLEPGAFSVAHLSATNSGSGIIAIETHAPRA
jgi:8-oxo-dGTP diphosphatase